MTTCRTPYPEHEKVTGCKERLREYARFQEEGLLGQGASEVVTLDALPPTHVAFQVANTVSEIH